MSVYEKGKTTSDAMRIARAIDYLFCTYKPEGIGVWLVAQQRWLGGESPLGLLHLDRVDEFCAACEAVGGMIAT